MVRFIIILGSKDGVGATTVAINLATALKALLVNLSYPGDLTYQLGTGNRKFSDVNSMLARRMLPMLKGYLNVPSKEFALFDSEEEMPVDFFKDAVPQLAKLYDFVVFDAGAVVSPLVVEAMRLGSAVNIVITPDHAILSEAARKVKRLHKSFYPGAAVIVNKWDDSVGRSVIADKLRLKPIGWLGDFRKARFSQELEEVVAYVRNVSEFDVSQVDWKEFAADGQKEPPADFKPEPENSSRLKQSILEKLLETVDMKELDGEKEALYKKTENAVVQILSQMELPAECDRTSLIRDVLDEALGLGPIEPLLKDNSVTEVMVNACDQIYVERAGKLELASCRFANSSQMMRAVERIVAPIGRRVDESSPMVDARLADGSRVNIVIPPLSLRGPTITIRKFSSKPLGMDNLVGFGALDDEMASFLRAAVLGRLNILVSGGTGSGKTTLLNVLSSFIPDFERIVTIEDAAELQLRQEHQVRLESRPANIEGRGAVSIRDLVRNALRMRPDRIVIGECRGSEALDMLQAMNTGHDGSLTTIHANSPRDSIARLETLVMFAGASLPQRAIREQIAAAIHIVVQLTRLKDGSRKIVKIAEISGMEGDVITMQDLFMFRERGVSPDGRVMGEFAATGLRTKFAEKLTARGVKI